MKKFLVLVALFLVIAAANVREVSNSQGWGRVKGWFSKLGLEQESQVGLKTKPKVETQKVVYQESVVINVVKKVSPSVVTVGIKKTTVVFDPFADLFDPFGLFPQRPQGQTRKKKIEQDIGSGFIVSADGLVITNKHVVMDPKAEYKVITNDNKKYMVEKIYRDPSVDLAILKIKATGLKPLELGNSDNLQLGQMAIAIGTALGEFRNTVTVGVISGLGRGIVAGDGMGAFSERLDNVIQTDAAINPGNSGGPLLNSAGQVIGVNVAVAQGAQNIGFAIPINVVKEVLSNFERTGRFSRPYLGVKYKMISQRLAILNEVPEGAYVVDVIEGSPADKAGIKVGDIIIKIDGESVKEKTGGLVKLIQKRKVGEVVDLEVWREGQIKKLKAKLEESRY
ncbi:MAG: PDZ domain-containing protein [bacterium]|nr:PDZ domain-containing protein [bacterium]